MKVSFLGLGIMGSRMAYNLLKNGVDLTVYNRTAYAAEGLTPLGAEVADNPAEAVEGADVIFTMLSAPEVVEELAFGKAGFVAYMKQGALWVDCSTVDPAFSLKAAKWTEAAGCRFIDAPVMGTRHPAETAQLVFVVGGSPEDLKEARPLLNYMGRLVIRVGEAGQGSALKMLVNSLLAQSMLVFAESVLLGEKMGLSRDFLLDFLPGLPVSPPFLKAKSEKIREGNYEVEFPLELMEKDLRLVMQSGEAAGQPQRMAALARELYREAMETGIGREDFSSVFAWLENLEK